MFSLHHAFQWRIHDFPDGGGGRRQPIIWPKFPDNYMKMKENESRGGRASLTLPLNPPMQGFVPFPVADRGGGVSFQQRLCQIID